MSNPQDAGPHSREGRPAPGARDAAGGTSFPDKPILEWTEEDWARWIASPPPASSAAPDPSPLPDEDARAAPEDGIRREPQAPAEEEPEIWVELEATSEMDVWAELAVDEAAAPAEPVPIPERSVDAAASVPEPDELLRSPVGASETAETEADGLLALDVGEEHLRGDVVPGGEASYEADEAPAAAPATDEASLLTTAEQDAWVPEVEPATPEPAAEGPFELGGAEAEEPPPVAEAEESLAVAAENAGEPSTVADPDEPLPVAAESDREPSPVGDEPTTVAMAAADERPPVAAEDVGEPSAVAVTEEDEPLPLAAEDAGEPVTVVGQGPAEVAPVQADHEPAPPVAGAEREWWEAVPPPLPPPPPLPSDADGRDEAGAGAAAATRALSGLADVPLAARPPHPSFAPPPPAPGRTPARGMPVTGVRPAPPRVQPVVIERSHRVRSALGLLGVAVLVGMMVAGLITVAIFAISVALRRAVG